MALDPHSTAFEFIHKVERAYWTLIQGPGGAFTQKLSLGGKLLYAGELDESGRALVVAGNVAGAASLAATGDPLVQKQAIRDGVVDFLVTSLDEALRILKNEIRKGETVAVCVGAAPKKVKQEMLERGVAPDLLRPDTISNADAAGSDSQPTPGCDETDRSAWLAWKVAAEPAQWLPKLDAIALECLEPLARAERRWLRLAPRYLGRLAHGIRSLCADREFAASFIEQVRQRVTRGEIEVPVEIQSNCDGTWEEHRFVPTGNSGSSG